METPAEDIYKQITAEAVTDVLRKEEFRKSGATYSRRCSDVVHIVNLQRSQWNSREDISFTVNLGVFVPGFITAQYNRPDPPNPREVDCCLRCRLGKIMPEEVDSWWTVKTGMDLGSLSEIKHQVKDGLEQFGLPFLAGFQTIHDVADYLREIKDQSQTGLIMPMPGMVGRYVDLIDGILTERAGNIQI